MLNFMDPEKQTRSWKVRSIQGAHDIWQWFQAVYQAVNNSDFDIFVCLCWRIWTSRNKMFMAAQLLIHMIRLPLSLNIYSSSSWLERDYQGPPDRNAAIWTPPTGNLVKVNFDASINKDPPFTGIGVVGRDRDGKVLACDRSSNTLAYNLSQHILEVCKGGEVLPSD